jgi:mannose-6-phosphate isomerase-like protein (cupin superfamily)
VTSVYTKDLRDCPEIEAGDASKLREILNPRRNPLALHFSLAHAEVGPGARTKPHRLESSEVYVILSGHGTMHVGGQTEPMSPGRTVYIPPGAVQFIENTGPTVLAFLCIVDPAWRAEDEVVLED